MSSLVNCIISQLHLYLDMGWYLTCVKKVSTKKFIVHSWWARLEWLRWKQSLFPALNSQPLQYPFALTLCCKRNSIFRSKVQRFGPIASQWYAKLKMKIEDFKLSLLIVLQLSQLSLLWFYIIKVKQRLHSQSLCCDYFHYIKPKVAIIVMDYPPGCRELINFNSFCKLFEISRTLRNRNLYMLR